MPKAPVSGTTQKENHKYNRPRATNYAPDRRHNGLDYYASKGTQVKASASGVVAFVGKFEPREKIVNVRHDKKEKRFTGAYGNVIIIYHGQNIKTQKHTCTLYPPFYEINAVPSLLEFKLILLLGKIARIFLTIFIDAPPSNLAFSQIDMYMRAFVSYC